MKEMPPVDVRGFDVRTGQQRWIFHAVPQGKEPGVETWEQDSWSYTGNTNVWTVMSCDEELGYVYLPFSTPTNDYYGGGRETILPCNTSISRRWAGPGAAFLC